MKRFLTILFVCLPLMAQAPKPQFEVGADTDVATTVRSVLLAPSGTAKLIRPVWATVYCENECVVTPKRNVAYSSGSTITVGEYNPMTNPSVTAKSGATITGGTSFKSYVVTAKDTLTIPMTMFVLQHGDDDNVALVTDSVSDRVVINIAVEQN